MKKVLKFTAFILIAALSLSSCGIIGKSEKKTTTSAATVAPMPTISRATTEAKTTKPADDDYYVPQNTTKAPASTADVSQQLTNLFKGEKLTDTKQYLIQSGIFESKIRMFTNSGETLDGAFNAPSTYDVTRIVYENNGNISIYGEKVRIVPDALKEFAGDVAMEAATQKIVDMILY